MKTSLEHLPKKKQFEINQIKDMIIDVINPEMIILFGSYAKGNWVEHRYHTKDTTLNEYISDYDFLVITQKVTEETSHQEWTIMDKADIYEPPVNLEIHELSFVNKGLEMGQYFFADIVKEGVLLYNASEVKFAEARILTAEEEKIKAQDYFDTWFPQASQFINTGLFASENANQKIAAFLLHQAAESLYYAVLLVYTGYKPKVHNLHKLRRKAKHISEELFLIFPIETDKTENHLFEQLKKGYIDARYKKDYFITKEEVELLIERLRNMIEVVERICKKKIQSWSDVI